MGKRSEQIPPREKIAHETPLRLAVVAAVAFPDGSMTVSGLRLEHRRGRLAIERMAGKDYTTLAAIERMRELCRIVPKARASTFAAPSTAASASTLPSGSSRAPDGKRAQAALRQMLQERTARSSITSKPCASARRTNGEPKQAAARASKRRCKADATGVGEPPASDIS